MKLNFLPILFVLHFKFAIYINKSRSIKRVAFGMNQQKTVKPKIK
jgi:hypothetical protein